MTERVLAAVKAIVTKLSEGHFHEIELITAGERLTAGEMRAAINEYGRTLVQPPNDGYQLNSIVHVRGSDPPTWSVVAPLWTREEGRSDLSVELHVTDDGHNLRVSLDGIHVL